MHSFRRSLRTDLSLTLFLLFGVLSAQTPQWAFSFGSDQYERAYGIEVDPAGNVYVCGAFDNTVDFDPDTVNEAIITEEGNGDVYLAKYTNAGELLWSFNLGHYFHDLGSDIAVDDEGNVYVTGYFRIDVDFDPGPNTATLTALSSRDVFVAKYDTDGNYLWAFNTAYGGNVERYPAIGLDPEGNVLVTGEFFGSPDFDPGPGMGTITSHGDQDIYLAKYTTDGDFLWAVGMGGPEYDRGMDVVADSQGNIYVTGMFRETADMDGDAGGATLTSNGGWDAFLAKYDGAGNHLWSFNMAECGMDLAMDANDNILLVGYYTTTPDMDPGPGVANLEQGPETNGFVAKYSADGAHLWSYGFADAGEGQTNSVAVDPMGHVYVTGYFDGIVDFDPGPEEALLVGWDFYTAKYDSEGNHLWSFDAGDTAYDGGWGIAVDDTANVYVTGVFWGTIDMDPDTSTLELVSEGGRDVFVAKYAPCARTFLPESICQGDVFTLPNGTEVGSSGLYPIAYTQAGCDSVVVTDLEVITLDATLTLNGTTLSVNEPDAQYQWLDCDDGNAEVEGATMQSFTPETSGTYAVRVTANGCTTISECEAVISTGIDTTQRSALLIHPNPATDEVRITTTGVVRSVELWTIAGQRLEMVYTNGLVPLQGVAPGVYRLTVMLEGGEVRSAMIVKR